MTVAAISPSRTWLENGSTVAFAVPFQFRAASDLQVTRFGPTGEVEALSYLAGYSVTGGNGQTGTVTMSGAKPTGWRLRVRRRTARSQAMDYTPGDRFPAESHEVALDRQEMQTQEVDVAIAETQARAILVPDGETAGPLARAFLRRNMLMGFDAAGAVATYPMTEGGLDPRYNEIINAVPLPITAYRQDGDTTDNPAWALAVADAVIKRRPVKFYAGMGLGPGGRYLIGCNGQNVEPATIGNLASDLVVLGEPGVEIQQISACEYIFYCNPAGNGTGESPHVVDAGDGFTGILFRDLTLIDDVETLGFKEHNALIHLSGVKGVVLENVQGIGWRGDCFHIGAGDIGGGTQNRHNADIQIIRCGGDGINKNNRNGLSVIDVDGMTIISPRFRNCTRKGGAGALDPFDPETGVSMPGAIDLEPNDFTLDPILRNVTLIDVGVDNCSGHALAILLRENDGTITAQRNFTVMGLTATNCLSPFSFNPQGEDLAESYEIDISGLYAENCVRSLNIGRGYGARISGRWVDCETAGFIGYEPGNVVRKLHLSGSMTRCGDGIGAFRVTGLKDSTIALDFTDCGFCCFTYAYGGAVSENNIISSRAFVTPGAAKLMEYAICWLDFAGDPVVDNGTNTEIGCDWGGLTHLGIQDTAAFAFAVNGSDVRSPPATGSWTRGNLVNFPKAARGEPTQWRCMEDNDDGDPPSFLVSVTAPGARPDDPVTPTWTVNKTDDLDDDDGGRFTSEDSAVQSTWSTETFDGAASPGVEIRLLAPLSGSANVAVGWSYGTDPVALADFREIDEDIEYAFWFNNGVVEFWLNTQVTPGFYGGYGPYELGQPFRITCISGMINLYRTELDDSETLVVAIPTAPTGPFHLKAAFNQPGASVRITKFAVP